MLRLLYHKKTTWTAKQPHKHAGRLMSETCNVHIGTAAKREPWHDLTEVK